MQAGLTNSSFSVLLVVIFQMTTCRNPAICIDDGGLAMLWTCRSTQTVVLEAMNGSGNCGGRSPQIARRPHVNLVHWRCAARGSGFSIELSPLYTYQGLFDHRCRVPTAKYEIYSFQWLYISCLEPSKRDNRQRRRTNTQRLIKQKQQWGTLH